MGNGDQGKVIKLSRFRISLNFNNESPYKDLEENQPRHQDQAHTLSCKKYLTIPKVGLLFLY